MITVYIGRDGNWHATMPDNSQVLIHSAGWAATRSAERPHVVRMAWQYWIQQATKEKCNGHD